MSIDATTTISFDASCLGAAALAAGAEGLLRLDPEPAERVQPSDLPLRAPSPDELIKTVLPDHVDFPGLR